ncbi:hypothetical protein BDW62DRAFT_102393 [Aspergillus aurantiobrunneus]
MYPLRRAACRLLASSTPVPVRSGLTAVPSAYRLAIPRRTFAQSRWVRDETRGQPDSKDAATPTPSTATATATTYTMTTVTDDAPNSSVEAETKKIQEGEAKGTVDLSNETETDKDQALDQNSDTTNTAFATTAASDTIGDEYQSELDFDVSQLREAADQEAENNWGVTKDEKEDIMLQSRSQPKETVFIGNLFYDVTAEDLRNKMSQYGIVEGVDIIYDNRGISKGFGYVQFDHPASATRAIQAMHMRIFEGRRVTMYYAQANLQRSKTIPPTDTLYIGNLPFELTDRDLNELFADIGNVIDVRVTVDRQTGQFYGYVHAEFTDIDSATIAHEQLSRKSIYGRKPKIQYSPNIKKLQRGHFPVAARS